MPLRLRLTFGALIGVLFLIPGLAMYREFAQRQDIWWTPPGMALSLAESQDRVRAERLPLHLMDAGAMGAGVVLLILVIAGRITYRNERPLAA